MPIAERLKRLRQLAKVAGQARQLVDNATRDDVGDDIFKAWCAEANISLASIIRDMKLVGRIADEIQKIIPALATIETAARRAAVDLHSRRGRPKGTEILPRECIWALAKVYRRSTGVKPGAGNGPFARFVHAFLTAVGRHVLEYHTVIALIKNARSSKEGSAVFK
jgi:hypothetical protein